MTGQVDVDSDHVRRVGARFSAFAEDLDELARRLAADLGAGAQRPGEKIFSVTWAELISALSIKELVVARDLDEGGAYLNQAAAQYQDIDDRATSALRRIGRGL